MSTESHAIAATAAAVERVSDSRVFPVLVALLAFLGFGALTYWNRLDQREERAAMLAALDRNTVAISEMSRAVEALEIGRGEERARDSRPQTSQGARR